MAAESDDEEWDTVERPAFFSGSPEKEPTRREPTPDGTEPYGELTVASVFDYTIERQGLRLCVTFAIQVVTAEGDAPQGESPNDFDAGCSRSPPFWTVRKEHNDFRELASAIVAELGGAADVEEVISRHLDRRHWTLNPNRFSERLTKYRVECLNNFLEARGGCGRARRRALTPSRARDGAGRDRG